MLSLGYRSRSCSGIDAFRIYLRLGGTIVGQVCWLFVVALAAATLVACAQTPGPTNRQVSSDSHIRTSIVSRENRENSAKEQVSSAVQEHPIEKQGVLIGIGW
jgi:hypothetical protein